MEITFNLAQIVAICTALTSIVTAYNLVRKPLKEKQKSDEEKDKKILTLLDNDKKRLDKLEDGIADIKDHLAFQSDMIYQMLDHLATNNNSGGMKDALDRYNQHFRRNL